MARFIALEWDDREARVAVASSRASDVVLEKLFAVDLPPAGDDESRDASIGRQLAERMQAEGLSGPDVLVAVGRANVELRMLNLPQTPPEERPDLVRFQSLQAFTNLGDQWPVDFVEIEEKQDGLSVLATAVSPDLLQQIDTVCQPAGLKPSRLLLRPFAAASLLRRNQQLDQSESCLIVDLLSDEADLTVTSHGQVVFMRTVRLPDSATGSSLGQLLVGELKRTISAAQNQLGGSRVGRIVICGDPAEHGGIADVLSSRLSLDVAVFNPLDGVRLGRELKRQPPPHPGRFTPLLGILADEAGETRHAIDFLNPRKRPEPPNNTRRNVLIGLSVAAVLLLVASLIWGRLHGLDSQIADLQQQSDKLAKEVELATEQVAHQNEVRDFVDGDITWLDELREMARHLPDADQAILDEVTVGAHPRKGGLMTLKGHVKKSSLIASFEDSLRYNDNVVSGSYGSVDPTNKEYPWVLNTVVAVKPDRRDRGRSLGRPYREQLRGESTSKPQATDAVQPSQAAATPTATQSTEDRSDAGQGEADSPPATEPAGVHTETPTSETPARQDTDASTASDTSTTTASDIE